MPNYNFNYDGKDYAFNYADELTPEQIFAAAPQVIADQQAKDQADAQAQQAHLARTGGINAALASFKQYGAATAAALGYGLGSNTLEHYGDEWAKSASQTFEPTTDADIKAAQGALPTAGAWLEQNVVEPGMGMVGRYVAPTLAGVAAVAALPAEAGVGETVAGVGLLARSLPMIARGLGFVGADIAAETGENIQRALQINPKQAPNIVSATGWGLVQSAIGGLGVPGQGAVAQFAERMLGAPAMELAAKVATNEITAQAAKDSLQGTLKNYLAGTATNAVAGTAMTVGTEAARRASAGQDVTGPEAMGAYGGATQGALALAPVISVFHAPGVRSAGVKAIDQAEAARVEQEHAAAATEREAYLATDEGKAEQESNKQALIDQYQQLQTINTKLVHPDALDDLKAAKSDVLTQLSDEFDWTPPKTNKAGEELPQFQGTPDEILVQQRAYEAQQNVDAKQDILTKAIERASAKQASIDASAATKQAAADTNAAAKQAKDDLAQAEQEKRAADAAEATRVATIEQSTKKMAADAAKKEAATTKAWGTPSKVTQGELPLMPRTDFSLAGEPRPDYMKTPAYEPPPVDMTKATQPSLAAGMESFGAYGKRAVPTPDPKELAQMPPLEQIAHMPVSEFADHFSRITGNGADRVGILTAGDIPLDTRRAMLAQAAKNALAERAAREPAPTQTTLPLEAPTQERLAPTEPVAEAPAEKLAEKSAEPTAEVVSEEAPPAKATPLDTLENIPANEMDRLYNTGQVRLEHSADIRDMLQPERTEQELATGVHPERIQTELESAIEQVKAFILCVGGGE